MITAGVLTAVFVISLAAVIIPLRYVSGTDRAIYCVWAVPAVAAVQGVAVYLLLYRHLRPLYYRAERAVGISVNAMSDEAIRAARDGETAPASFAFGGATNASRTAATSPFDTSLYLQAAKMAEKPSADLTEATRLRRLWRRPERRDTVYDDTSFALADVVETRKALQSVVTALQRLETKQAAAFAAV
jgi:hypothetical protein